MSRASLGHSAHLKIEYYSINNMKQYLRKRRINKLRIKIAGLEEVLRFLYKVEAEFPLSYDRNCQLITRQQIAKLKMHLEILTEPKQ